GGPIRTLHSLRWDEICVPFPTCLCTVESSPRGAHDNSVHFDQSNDCTQVPARGRPSSARFLCDGISSSNGQAALAQSHTGMRSFSLHTDHRSPEWPDL